MKSLRILLLLFAIVSTAGVYAQGKKEGKAQKTPQELATKRAERWQKELNLTDEQKAQIQQAIEKRITAMRSKDKATAKQAREDFKASLQTILTPEQQEKVKAKMLERKATHGKAKGNKGKKSKSDAGEDADDDDIE